MKHNLVATYRAIKHGLADAMYQYRTRELRAADQQRRLVVFYLFAETQKYPHSLDIVEQAVSRLHGVDTTLVLINNFDEGAEFQQVGPRRFSAPGDNSQWEFSGWKRGVRLFDSLSLHVDLALFVNDAFMNLTTGGQDRYWFRNAFNSLTLSSLGHRALGHVHSAPLGHEIVGWNCGCFLQTHAFAMPYAVARRLKFTPLNDSQWQGLMSKSFTGQWFTDTDHLSPAFQEFAIRYLTQEWHARRPFDEKNWPLLRAKTMAIINERLFSQDLVDNGCDLMNASRVSLWMGASRVVPVPSGHRSEQNSIASAVKSLA